VKKHISFFSILLVLSLLFTINNASASVKAKTFEGGLHLGIYNFHPHQDIDNGFLFGATIGYNFTEHIGAEGILDYISAEGSNVKVDVTGYTYRLEGLYHFLPEKKTVPFLAIGFGGVALDYDNGGSDTGGLFDWGGGVKYAASELISIRADVRQYLTFSQAFSNFSFTVGATYLFGKGVGAARRDRDGDGIMDDKDSCPDTPDGMEVDALGCALPLERPVSLSMNIQFDKNRFDIKPIYQPFLKRVAKFMKDHPKTKARIEGHTDYKGKASYNLKISRKRAAAVSNYIIKKLGISPSRITALGLGEEKPIADNRTPEGRSQNRRVIIIISK
jgi:OOP family OmpA-OmpF porin